MRQIFKRVGKSTLSIILCVMMVFSTMLIGTVAVNAVDNNFVGGETIFLVPSAWNTASAKFGVYFFNRSDSSISAQWILMTDDDSDGVYSATIPGDCTWTNVIFLRLNSGTTATDGKEFPSNDTWNQTGDLSGKSGMNCYTIPDAGAWSKPGDDYNNASCWSYIETAEKLATPTISVDSTEIAYTDGSSVTLTVTNHSDYASAADVSYYLYKDGTQYDTFTSSSYQLTEGGSYTVKAVPSNTDDYVESAASSSVTVTKAVQTFSVVVDDVANATVSATPTTATSDTTINVTVTPDAGFTCTGITVTAENGTTVTPTGSGTSWSFTMPASNVNVTATILAKEAATINVSPSDTSLGSVKYFLTDNGAYVGEQFTVTATPAAGARFVNWTIEGATITKEYTNLIGLDLLITDPTVKVVANFEELPTYTVTAKSNNTSMGTVSPATSTVYEGDTVTLTATPKSDCTFSNWTLTGDYTIVSGYATTDTTLKITVNGAVTATATFQEDPGVEVANRYLVWSTSDAYTSLTNYMPIYRMSNGEYIAKFSDSVDIEPNTNYFFALSSTQDYNGMFWQNNTDAITVTTNDENLISFEKKENGQKYFGRFSFSSSEVTDIEICVGTNSNDGLNNIVGTNYDVRVISNVPDGAIKIWAKDGSTVDGGTNKYGETKITSGTLEGSTVADAGTYRTYYAPKEGGIITIQTQITDPSSGYYVYAYVINGQTVTTTSKGSGIYESTYSVPADYEGTIEITPVYFNTKIEEAGDYITFYVNASEVSELWGNTVACYSYYYYDEANKKAYDGEGAYPGQPMLLNANGKYFTKLARYYYDETGTKKEYQISGITINNFYEYDIHKNLLTGDSAKNHQTYDYNDFKFLSDPALNYDTIQFDIKYRTSTTNQSTLNNGNAGAVDTDSITISTFTGQNGWDDFVDYDGNLIDIQGNAVTNKENKIYIVSTGNQDTSVGTWSTVWYVYDADGKYITQGNPSDFIPRSNPEENTEAYNTMTQYAGYYTQICFESYMDASTSTDSDNSGKRVDGRWYYKNSQDSEVTVDVNVQYSDDNGSSWSVGSDGKKGVATIDGVTEITYPQANIEAALNAIAGDGYMFVEWGTVDDDGNNYKTVSTKVTDKFFVDTNYHLVARFIKVDDHELVISHEKYAGPDAVGGYGFYYASATLTHKNGTTTEYPQTQDAFKVPLNYITDDTLEITLTTVCSGDNTFMYWYQYVDGEYQIIEPEEDVYGKKGTVSYTFEMNVADLYKDANTLVVQALNFYSDIARVTADAVLNYKYYNRFGEEKTYTKKITLDDWYIDKNGYTLTDPLIYENAPAIDDLYKDCKWTITDQTVTKNATTATLWATQPDKTYDVKFVETVNGEKITKQSATVYLNDYIAVDQNGAIYGSKDDPENIKFFEAAQKSTSGDDFAYWLVKDTDTGEEVAKCYYYQFNLRIVGNYTIEAVYNDEATSITISDPTYTREQFTDSEGKVVTDYLYVDFIVAYMESNGVLLNSAGDNYKTGLVVEFDKDVKVNVKDAVGGKLTDDAKANATFDSDAATIKDFILTGDDKKVYDTDDADSDVNRALYNFAIDNTKYNNKNRLDFYVRYDNTPNIRQYAMKAYYYVYQVDANGNLVEGTYNITAPVYFYFYEIGNSKSVTSTPTALTVSS